MGKAAAAATGNTGSLPQNQRKIPRVIAVDGSAASGKSSVGRQLAAALGYAFLDTGIMYRAITLIALHRGVRPDDERALERLANETHLDVRLTAGGPDGQPSIWVDGANITSQLRRPDVEDAVSLVSCVPGVREALVRKQREIAGQQPIVVAGRDIGTVVLPGADLKIYLSASPEVRARRRYADFAALGRDVSRQMVLEDLRRRDHMDSRRAASPLRPAADAVIIDTSRLTQNEVLERVLGLAGDAP